MVGLYLARCGSLSLVTCSLLASGHWDGNSAWLVLSFLPDLSREFLPIDGGTCAGRTWAYRHHYRSLSLCAASHVRRFSLVHDRDAAFTWILVRCFSGTGF